MLAWENVSVSAQQLTSKTPACKNVWRLKQMMLLFSCYSCQRRKKLLLKQFPAHENAEWNALKWREDGLPLTPDPMTPALGARQRNISTTSAALESEPNQERT